MTLSKRACQQIADLRNQLNIPIVQLANKAGLSKSAVGRICTSAKVTVTIDEYVSLISALSDCPAEHLQQLINQHE